MMTYLARLLDREHETELASYVRNELRQIFVMLRLEIYVYALAIMFYLTAMKPTGIELVASIVDGIVLGALWAGAVFDDWAIRQEERAKSNEEIIIDVPYTDVD